MTRKDYVALAQKLAETGENPTLSTRTFWIVIENIADVLQTDNPRFKRQRFLDACNPANLKT